MLYFITIITTSNKRKKSLFNDNSNYFLIIKNINQQPENVKKALFAHQTEKNENIFFFYKKKRGFLILSARDTFTPHKIIGNHII